MFTMQFLLVHRVVVTDLSYQMKPSMCICALCTSISSRPYFIGLL